MLTGTRHYASDKTIKWIVLGVSILAFILSLHLPAHFDRAQFRFPDAVPTISSGSRRQHSLPLGVDGISMWLVVLTTF